MSCAHIIYNHITDGFYSIKKPRIFYQEAQADMYTIFDKVHKQSPKNSHIIAENVLGLLTKNNKHEQTAIYTTTLLKWACRNGHRAITRLLLNKRTNTSVQIRVVSFLPWDTP